MNHIHLHAHQWSTEQDFYNAFLSAVRTPDWHGRNLDALHDGLLGGLWEVEPPLTVEVTGSSGSPLERNGFLARVGLAFEDAREEGVDCTFLFR